MFALSLNQGNWIIEIWCLCFTFNELFFFSTKEIMYDDEWKTKMLGMLLNFSNETALNHKNYFQKVFTFKNHSADMKNFLFARIYFFELFHWYIPKQQWNINAQKDKSDFYFLWTFFIKFSKMKFENTQEYFLGFMEFHQHCLLSFITFLFYFYFSGLSRVSFSGKKKERKDINYYL